MWGLVGLFCPSSTSLWYPTTLQVVLRGFHLRTAFWVWFLPRVTSSFVLCYYVSIFKSHFTLNCVQHGLLVSQHQFPAGGGVGGAGLINDVCSVKTHFSDRYGLPFFLPVPACLRCLSAFHLPIPALLSCDPGQRPQVP